MEGLRDLVGFGGAKESAWVEGVNGSIRWRGRVGGGLLRNLAGWRG